jgi:hypothetical protein
MNGYSTGSNIASLFGASIGFNILGKALHCAYAASQGQIVASRKNSDSFTLFKYTVLKTIAISLVYLYMGLGIYFSFDNSFYIPETSVIGGAYVVGLVLDTIIIDTTCALVASLFAGKNDR